ncbi:MAG TPA: hypothetical protein VFA33_15005 [Bryobacteraceae bacterium]|nr:hypothetical protein [Bryobacteraceae bacterium]
MAIFLPALATYGQTTLRPEWRKIGSPSYEWMLASPATGRVDAVWFSADGARLFARAHSGKVFETADFETWTAVPASDPAPAQPSVAVNRLPEPGARVVVPANGDGRMYALGAHLYRSEDGGRTWQNLTAADRRSVIGEGQHSLAVSPTNPEQLVIGNDYGVWKSMDGGLSWAGLNQYLPNLPAQRILAAPNGAHGTRIVVDGLGALELPPGSSAAWQPARGGAGLEAETAAKNALSALLGVRVTAVASAGDTVYAGTAEGQVRVSLDGGKSFQPAGSQPAASGAVERVWVDGGQPRVALAALAGTGARVWRTTNGGMFWDDLSANLPEAPVHAVVADRTSGAVYVATDKGVFLASEDLENPGPAAPWAPVTTNLPDAPATDVRLDPAGNQLYVALVGYGIYAAPAPHRARVLHVVNAADFSSRAAAPGSLLSVIGGKVSAARAGGLAFPVLASSNAQSQVQVPFEAAGPNVSLALDTASGRFTFPLPVQPVSPAIFVSSDGAPMLLDADSGLMLDAHNTAHSNSRIQVLATGLGRVRPDWPSGVAAPLENPPAVTAQVRAFVDRQSVPVTRATLAPGYVGLYLVELQLPALVNAGPAELYLTADGQESNRVQIFLEP